jgi:hypothetical protein
MDKIPEEKSSVRPKKTSAVDNMASATGFSPGEKLHLTNLENEAMGIEIPAKRVCILLTGDP